MSKQPITEESGVHREWYKRARTIQSVAELSAFIKELSNKYEHDYGTICHAIAAGAIAAAWTVDRSPSGGITGFQAGAVMWEFIQHWMFEGNKCGLRLIDYDDLLYPQYAEKFDKKISKDVMEKLQSEAKELLKESAGHESVRKHWQSLADGNPPFGFRVVAD